MFDDNLTLFADDDRSGYLYNAANALREKYSLFTVEIYKEFSDEYNVTIASLMSPRKRFVIFNNTEDKLAFILRWSK